MKTDMANLLQTKIQNEDSLLNFCFTHHSTPPCDSIRVERSAAQRWLLSNRSVIRDGNVRYLQIKDLGLGVCEVRLQPVGKVGTFTVKTFAE